MESDRWVEVSPSQFTHEAEGLRLARELLPDVEPFRAWSNFEFRDSRGRWHEVDLLVLGRDTLYLVELKYYSGTLRGNDHRWLRDGRGAEDSPLKLAHRKAQYFASVLRDRLQEHMRAKGEFRADPRDYVPWVQEAVFLHHPSLRCELPEHSKLSLYGLDGNEDASGLPGLSELLLAPAKRDPVTPKNAALLAGLIKHIGLVPRRQREAGSWVIDDEPLASGDGWQDWPAFHRTVTTDRARIRFYIPDPEGTRAQELALKRTIDYRYRLLRRLSHDGVAVPQDFVTDELGFGLVYRDDQRSSRLDLWLARHGTGLTLAEQLDIIRQLAEAMSYAHRHRVVHRGLAPSAVAIRERGGGYAVTVADWEAAGSVPGAGRGTASESVLPDSSPGDAGEELVGEARMFEAPEGRWAADADRVRLDVFALGATAFYLLTNQTLPAQDPGALVDRLRRDSGLDLAAELPQVPSGLRELVLAATDPRPSERTATVAAFLRQLDEVEAAFAAPEAVEEPDPLEAKPGAVLGGQFTYRRKLGSGSTAVGLLVEDARAGDALRVLKVAKNAEAAERLHAEEHVLGKLNHDRIVTLMQHVQVAARDALVLQYAGESTLAEELASKRGRLSLDLLERWGGDLLDALVALDTAGVTHRDIKPSNLGVHKAGRAKSETHLMLFDFSMAGTGGRAVTAGTPPYLDPFLGHGERSTYDSAAERYGAAVVLYEMATGMLPCYGDDPDANPASVADDVTIPAGAFDPAVTEDLAAFFRAALSRDVARRHDTAEDMRAAWRAIFKPLGRHGEDTAAKVAGAALDTGLGQSGLSARAISVLEPAGVGTVADLLGLDPARLSRLLRPETKTTKEEIRKRVAAWRKEFGAQPRGHTSLPGGEASTLPDPLALAELLASKRIHPRSPTRRQAARLILGLEPGLDPFASQQELAKAVGRSAPRGHQLINELQEAWSRDRDAKGTLETLVAVLKRSLDTLGGVATVRTLTGEVLAALPEPPRGAAEAGNRVAAGLLRLALDRYHEHERAASEETLAKRRHGNRLALLARNTVLLDAAEAAATRADELVTAAQGPGEPVVGQQRAAREIRAAFTEAFAVGSEAEERPPAITDLRLVRLAAQTSREVALSTRGELHPRNLAAATAVRMALSGIAQSTELTVEELVARVQARFPDLDPLPPRPDLDAVVESSGIGLRYAPEDKKYRVPSEDRPDTTGFPTRMPSVVPAATEESLGRGDHVGRVLARSVSISSFLALGVAVSRSDEPARAARVLRERYDATVLDVTGLLIEAMRETARASNLPWEVVRAADAAQPGSRDAKGLRTLVEKALPEVTGRIDAFALGGGAASEPVVLTELSPLARYGHLNVVARWSDLTAKRSRPVWVVLPQLSWMRGAVVDGKPLQLGSNGQFVELDADWLVTQEAELDGDTPTESENTVSEVGR